jgi:tripartite-type tricarboxylate transporter receptor subunit TctC
MRILAHCVIGSLTACWLGSLAVDDAVADDFFKGKEITLYVGSSSGGPYDAYARMLARHMGRNIAGNPSFVVQNMPGASGRRLMGHMQGLAPKDGTAMAAGHRALPFDPLMGVKSKFNPTNVTWIGSANDETNICVVWHASKIQTFDDLKKHEMVVGSGGPASTDTIYPNIMNALFGTKIRVVGGYKAAAETHIAMERGEVDGRCGLTWDALQSVKPGWIKDKKVRILVQFALEKHPDLAAVPSVFDFAKTEAERQVLALWAAPNKMGRPFYAPIELPKARRELLRRAFDRTMKDPALLAEVKKTKLFVSPLTGEQIEALIKRVYATPKDVVARAVQVSQSRQ